MRLRNDLPKLFLFMVLVTHALGIGLSEILRSHLGESHIPLMISGFWITYPALKLTFGRGLLVTILLALWIQSFSCFALSHVLGLSIALYSLLQWARSSLQENAKLPFTPSAIALNAFWIASIYCLYYKSPWQKGIYIKNAFTCLLIASLFIASVGPFWVKMLDHLKFRLNRKH
jgi:hypothetical protein